jgi:MoaA/NifB/PqqE/SkfB family radical SAM enzyme
VSARPAANGAPPWIGPDGQRVERLELHLSYRCPNRCRFCSEADRLGAYRDYPVSWGMVATVLRRHAERGVSKLHLTGGEPTIHPRLVDALTMARKLGMSTSVSTNGVMLCREPFAREVVPLLDDCMFSLHGPEAEVHERLTGRRGSFDQAVGAIELSRQVQPTFSVHVNIVVTRDNVDVLGETVELAGRLGASLIVVSNVSPEGRAAEDYREVAVPLSQLQRIVPTLPPRAPEAIVRFFAVPMCLLGGHAMLSNDLYWDPRVTVEWGEEPGKVAYHDVYSYAPSRGRIHVAQCVECLHRKVCTGVFEAFVVEHPDEIELLRPLKREDE